MSIFVCDECGCEENTGLGQFWCAHMKNMYPPEFQGRELCSACASPVFADGGSTGLGKWHGKWKQRKWDGIREVCNRKVVNGVIVKCRS